MKENIFSIHYPLLSQDADNFPVEVLSGKERYQEDEDDERGITDAKSERCPHCTSDQIKRITTKAGHTVLRCPICRNYFCLHCKEILLDRKRLDTKQGPIQCPQCNATV